MGIGVLLMKRLVMLVFGVVAGSCGLSAAAMNFAMKNYVYGSTLVVLSFWGMVESIFRLNKIGKSLFESALLQKQIFEHQAKVNADLIEQIRQLTIFVEQSRNK